MCVSMRIFCLNQYVLVNSPYVFVFFFNDWLPLSPEMVCTFENDLKVRCSPAKVAGEQCVSDPAVRPHSYR